MEGIGADKKLFFRFLEWFMYVDDKSISVCLFIEQRPDFLMASLGFKAFDTSTNICNPKVQFNLNKFLWTEEFKSRILVKQGWKQ